MVVCEGSEVVVGARKNLPQIFVCEVDEKGSLRRRQVSDTAEDKVKYVPGTSSTPHDANRYPQTYGTFETVGGSYVPSPPMDGSAPPVNPQNPLYLQVPPTPHHDSPPRKKSRDEYGFNSFGVNLGDSGFHDDASYQEYQANNSSFRGYGKRSPLGGVDGSSNSSSSSRSWKRSHGLDGSVWTSISSPVEDLRRKMKGRASFTDENMPWIDVSKQQVIQGLCLFVVVTSIAFGLVGFARHFSSGPLEERFTHGKYRSIEAGLKMWKDRMEEEGRVLGANIMDREGNVLLGGKKASIQFAHDYNKAQQVQTAQEEEPFPEAEVEDKAEDTEEVVSIETRSPTQENDKEEVKSIKELTEEIRQIADMLKIRDSGLDEKVQTDDDYDELVLRNQLEEKNRKKKQLLQKVNNFGHFSSGRVAPLSPTSNSRVEISSDDSTDEDFDSSEEDLETDEDFIDDEIEETMDLNNVEVLDEPSEVNEVSQFDNDENIQVGDESEEDNFDEKKAEEQLKKLLDEVKVTTKKIEESKAIKKASKKKTKNKNPLKEMANFNKKRTKAVKSTATKSKASDKSSKIIDLNTDKELSDAFEEKLKGGEVTKTKRKE